MAYEFNGGQFLNTPTTSAVVSGMPLTMACWFYANNATTRYTLMTLANDMTGWSGGGYNISARGDVAGDPVQIVTDLVGNTIANSSAGYSATTWSHACGVFTSTTSRTVYLNGGNSATNTVSFSPAVPNQGLRIARFANNFSNYLGGRIAECGVWSAALNADEVAALSKGMTCDKIRPQSLVYYSPLVRNLIDYKGGLTITNNSTATVATHPRVYA